MAIRTVLFRSRPRKKDNIRQTRGNDLEFYSKVGFTNARRAKNWDASTEYGLAGNRRERSQTSEIVLLSCSGKEEQHRRNRIRGRFFASCIDDFETTLTSRSSVSPPLGAQGSEGGSIATATGTLVAVI